ncbi:MAG: transposase [Sedimenticola sp.]
MVTNTKADKADRASSSIGKLYSIKRRIKGGSTDVRKQIRQEESRVVLEKLRVWLDRILRQVLPKGALGEALAIWTSTGTSLR